METVKNQRNVVKEDLKSLSIYIAAVVKEIIEKLPVKAKRELLLRDTRGWDAGGYALKEMCIWLSSGRMYKTPVRGQVSREYDETPETFFGSYIDSVARADEIISKIENILSKHNIKIEGKYLPKEN